MSGSEILIITSYPPRKCGIATYSQDLIQAIEDKYTDDFSIGVCALLKQDDQMEYGHQVKYFLKTYGYVKTIPAWQKRSILTRTLGPSTYNTNLASMVVNWGTI